MAKSLVMSPICTILFLAYQFIYTNIVNKIAHDDLNFVVL